MQEIKERLALLDDEVKKSISYLDLPAKKLKLKELEAEMSDPDFWSNQEKAQKTSREAGLIRNIIDEWEKLGADVKDVIELAEMIDEADSKSISEVKVNVDELEKRHNKMNTELYLSGPYDSSDAVISFHAGTGGVDAQDFAEMLMRMYLRFCEKRGWKTTQTDFSAAEEAGIKSASFKVSGPYAFGYLKGEAGVHRLVRLSPFNSKGTRETSFALVEVVPEVDEKELEIREDDLEWDFFRSSGAGGQNVNKTDSAARVTHKPTGLSVACQTERSQMQNRQNALKLLTAKLVALQQKHHLDTIAEIKGEHTQHSWGNQIRSYVLQPYQMVKDHRTDYETSQTEDVLNGELDGFIEAELKAKL
jgi:peptide chain release factor 2